MKSKVLALMVSVVLVVGLLVVPALAGEKVLNVGQGAEPVTLDPQNATDNPSYEVCRHIYDGLVEFDKQLNIHPKLAKKWTVSKDGKVWTFYLRKGIKFHSGADFDAMAVKKNFDRLLTGKYRRSSLYTPFIKEVKVVDKYTVQFILKVPFGAFLHILAHGAGLILDPTLIDKNADIKHHPSGTGPFKFKEWVPGDHITLVANKNYWGGKPKIDKIVFRTIPEDTSRTMMLETGELDVAERVSPFDVARLKKNKNIKLDIAPSLRVIYIIINNYRIKDVRVRRALNYAVNKAAICKSILKGFAEPDASPLAPLTWGYADVKGYPYNPKKAKELLAEAGWKDTNGDGILDKNGKKFVLKFFSPHGRYLMDYKVAEAVQGYLKAVGIDARLSTADWATYLASLRKPPEKAKYDLALLGWAPSTGDADWVLRPLFLSTMWAPKGGNRAFYANKEADKYILEGMTTVDPKKRKEAYRKAQEIIVRDAPWVFLHVQKTIIGYRKNVHNVIELPLEILLVKYAWKD